MIKRYLLGLVLILSCTFSLSAFAEKFVISDLQFEGLQRVTLGAALLSLPIREGDSVDDYDLSQAIKKLYKSSHFESIKLMKNGNTLIFKVQERPTISNIELVGNEKLTDDQILDSLKSSKISVGDTLDRTTLSSIEKSLEDFYHSVGKYSAKVNATVTTLPRNRASLQITFREGQSAKIEQINIVGNRAFTDKKLLDLLTLSESGGWWDLFANDNSQKQQLSADLEVIKSYYLDRGYIRFKIEDTQVSLTPNKKGVYVTVNVNEGDIYKVAGVNFIGDLLNKENDIKALVPFIKGDTYSASNVTATEQNIRKYLGRLGYAYPKITTYPEVNDATHTVVVNFSIAPGQRVYVRNINISGNSATKDVVLRRQMRQMEGSWLSSENVELSKNRLNRLGFFSNVAIDTDRISNDLVDLNTKVEERASGSFTAGIGYGTDSGVSVNGGIQQDNFLGTGDKLAISVAQTDYTFSSSLSYTTPYLTEDAVSGGVRLFYNIYDAGEEDVADFTSTSYGIKFSSGFPVNEYNRLGFSVGWENYGLSKSDDDDITQSELAFWDIYNSDLDENEEDNFQNFTTSARWTLNTLDRGSLPTQGTKSTLSVEGSTPGSDLQYYKVNFNVSNYHRITRDGRWTMLLRGSAGYGDGYGEFNGEDQVLPYFDNYYVGGYRTVRGFASGSIGPKEITDDDDDGTYDIDDDSTGGNAKYTLSAELIFPAPFIDEAYTRSIRTSVFVDAGEVWDTEFDYDTYSNYNYDTNEDYLADYSKPGRIRVSTGVQLTWMSPLGALVFVFAKPIKDYAGDESEFFSFNIGQSF